LVTAWYESSPNLSHKLDARQTARSLSKSLFRVAATDEILSLDPELARRVKKTHRKPYIFSESEITMLLDAAKAYPFPDWTLRPTMLYTIIVLAYCAGLRAGEVGRLTLSDIHLDDGVIEINETKFFKSRVLPLTSNVIDALKTYLAARASCGAPTSPDSALFWDVVDQKPFSLNSIRHMVIRVFRLAGLKPKRGSGKRGPRMHDLRHSFAINRMLAWYRSGINPQSQLPQLATYMGHRDIKSTLVYLRATPELLQSANERFRTFAAHALHFSGDTP
jgi:integrase/recombinase XerD